jgi:hypothetical protein
MNALYRPVAMEQIPKVIKNKNKGYMDRAMEHMDALEKKTDRVIELLEEIKKK